MFLRPVTNLKHTGTSLDFCMHFKLHIFQKKYIISFTQDRVGLGTSKQPTQLSVFITQLLHVDGGVH